MLTYDKETHLFSELRIYEYTIGEPNCEVCLRHSVHSFLLIGQYIHFQIIIISTIITKYGSPPQVLHLYILTRVHA